MPIACDRRVRSGSVFGKIFTVKTDEVSEGEVGAGCPANGTQPNAQVPRRKWDLISPPFFNSLTHRFAKSCYGRRGGTIMRRSSFGERPHLGQHLEATTGFLESPWPLPVRFLAAPMHCSATRRTIKRSHIAATALHVRVRRLIRHAIAFCLPQHMRGAPESSRSRCNL